MVTAMILGAVMCQSAEGMHVVANGTLLTVGGQTTMTCGRTAVTEDYVYWWKDDRQIHNDTGKYLIQMRDTNSSLTSTTQERETLVSINARRLRMASDTTSISLLEQSPMNQTATV